ncbi:hypothetical protein LCGC14_0704680 [marine sediment metagenome]|uniref:Uncharacterized protein n=1 Tax=marine sediment metagenome TaxID=412755 RepID=A0A0F9T2S7_9ZZZZ|nr:hypothetical protein [archaeon]
MSQNEVRQKILDLLKDSIKTNPNPRDAFTVGRGKNSEGQNLSGGLDFGLQKGLTQDQVGIESWLSNRIDDFISEKGSGELRIDDLSRSFMNYMIAILGNLGEITITGSGKNNEKQRLILKVVAVERISTDEKKSTTFPAKLVGSQGDKKLEIDNSKVLSTAGSGGPGSGRRKGSKASSKRKKGKPSAWINFVKETSKQKNISFREALKVAGPFWKKMSVAEKNQFK